MRSVGVYDPYPECAMCGYPRTAHDPVTGACPRRRTREIVADVLFDGLKGTIIAVVIFIVLVIAGIWGYHKWWTSTHCTTVVGTQVCK